MSCFYVTASPSLIFRPWLWSGILF